MKPWMRDVLWSSCIAVVIAIPASALVIWLNPDAQPPQEQGVAAPPPEPIKARTPISREDFAGKGGLFAGQDQRHVLKMLGLPDIDSAIGDGNYQRWVYYRATFHPLTKRVDSAAVIELSGERVQRFEFIP